MDYNQCLVITSLYTYLDKPSAKSLRFILACTTARYKLVNKQKDKNSMIQDAGISQESYSKHKNISKLWCYWRTDRLNHVLTHFRQTYKTINTA